MKNEKLMSPRWGLPGAVPLALLMSPRWGYINVALPGRYTGYINVAPLGLARGGAPFCINLVLKGLTLKPLLAPSVSIIKARGNAPRNAPFKFGRRFGCRLELCFKSKSYIVFSLFGHVVHT